MDFNVKLSNGQVLNGIIQSPGENAKGVIILIHGLGEHIRRYNHWAGLFNKSGIGFAGVDLPGHGRSDGRRGDIKNYALLDEMIDILLYSCKQTFPGIPLYIYGHSLGGGIVLNYILRRNPEIKGAIVTSPWLRLSFEPSRVKLIMASVMKNLVPGLVQSSGLNVSHISHNKDTVEKYETDPLVHGKISVSLFHGAMTAAKYSLSHASELKVRTLILHGSDDQITSPEGSREFAEKTDMAELMIFNGGYHELHNEPFKDDVFIYILNWMNRRHT
ncbi:MAG: alpha/beta hydrolase [Bacteroidales bacterium]|nr:alpha/beta hydrolase [Bacteroidales bacterium]